MQQSRMIDRRCFYYVFIVVVIRHETTAAAGWTLMFIVRAFVNYTITVAIWTSFSFHLCLMWILTIHDRPVPALPLSTSALILWTCLPAGRPNFYWSLRSVASMP